MHMYHPDSHPKQHWNVKANMNKMNAVQMMVFAGTITFISCQWRTVEPETTNLVINTSHLDHLFEKINLPNRDTMAIVHIYSEYPNYAWVGDADEGISCVDDVARAAIFYLRNYHYTSQSSQLEKALALLSFILYMQAENGYFYNFIFSDYSINRDGITSKAEPNWWSWRAFWAFGEALGILDPAHPIYQEIILSRHKLIDAIIEDAHSGLVDSFQTIEGLNIPRWLPSESAADQAALLVLGLAKLDTYKTDSTTIILHDLIDGIIKMQVNNDEVFPHGAFLSWQNVWHAYGNNQSYALLTVANTLGDTSALAAALMEINFFYKELTGNILSHFEVTNINGQVEINNTSLYPQIAYNLRPIIWACIAAGTITGEERYNTMGKKISQWFVGENPSGVVMYDSNTGRCFDGINNAGEINQNSGAESTIEALLAIQELSRIVK